MVFSSTVDEIFLFLTHHTHLENYVPLRISVIGEAYPPCSSVSQFQLWFAKIQIEQAVTVPLLKYYQYIKSSIIANSSFVIHWQNICLSPPSAALHWLLMWRGRQSFRKKTGEWKKSLMLLVPPQQQKLRHFKGKKWAITELIQKVW